MPTGMFDSRANRAPSVRSRSRTPSVAGFRWDQRAASSRSHSSTRSTSTGRPATRDQYAVGSSSPASNDKRSVQYRLVAASTSTPTARLSASQSAGSGAVEITMP